MEGAEAKKSKWQVVAGTGTLNYSKKRKLYLGT